MMQIMRKIRQKGLFGSLEATLRRVEAPIGRFQRRLEALRLLQQANHTAVFIHEGGDKITLPQSSPLRGALGLDHSASISADFLRSCVSEAMLRHTLFRLYAGGRIDPGKSIIDIGCWCGDNSLRWAKWLDGAAVVYGIDPSAHNLAYAKALAEANGISNLRWVQAVCDDRVGNRLRYDGPLEHTRFQDAGQTGGPQVTSTTLDEIVGPDNHGSIALMHVDVEGLEQRVLRGAARIIEKSSPVIVYEQHLCDDDAAAIFDDLVALGYQVFMVNESIPHCRADCRNFIAFPSGFAVPAEMTQRPRGARPVGHVPAVLGPDLLPFDFVPRIVKKGGADAQDATAGYGLA